MTIIIKITAHAMNVFLKVSGLSSSLNLKEIVTTNMKNGKNTMGKTRSFSSVPIKKKMISMIPTANHAKAARSIILISSGYSLQVANRTVFFGWEISVLLIVIPH